MGNLRPLLRLVREFHPGMAAGTHDELAAQGGRYAELFDLQVAGLR